MLWVKRWHLFWSSGREEFVENLSFELLCSCLFSWAWSWTGCACCMRRHQWAKKSPNAARSRWWTDGHVSLLWHLTKHMYPKPLMRNCSPSMQIYAPFPMLRNKSRNKREEYFTTLCVGSLDSENCKRAAFSEIVIIYLKYKSIDHDKQIRVSRIKWIFVF